MAPSSRLPGSALPSARRQLVACLALAAELAADWGIVPFELPGVADWSAMFAADPQRDNRPQMALDLVQAAPLPDARSLPERWRAGWPSHRRRGRHTR
jgi:hypothetical protein